jgi:hypothetical protein
MPTQQPPDRPTVEQWVRDIHTTARNLTPWELDFMKGMIKKVEMGWHISPKQIETIERIYAARTPLG